jgi:hypothetical protein
MNPRWALASAAPLTALLVLAVLHPLVGTPHAPLAFLVIGVGVVAAAAAGCFVAAAQFDRTDYMRGAWALLGTTYVLVVVNTLVFGSGSHGTASSLSQTAAVLSGVLVTMANACTVVGGLRVARAWSVAGLTLSYSRPVRLAAGGASLVVGMLIAGAPAWTDLFSVLGGQLDGIANLASDVGDIVSLAVLAPILLTALSFRGGSLAWPWAMIVAGTLGWLALDATGAVFGLIHANPAQVVVFEMAFRAFACVSFLAAGLLQRAVVRAAVELPQPAAG